MKAEMKKKAEQTETEPVKELREQIWAVITFDQCAARGLTYLEAEKKMAELKARKVAGLCIVSNAVADRLKPV